MVIYWLVAVKKSTVPVLTDSPTGEMDKKKTKKLPESKSKQETKYDSVQSAFHSLPWISYHLV